MKFNLVYFYKTLKIIHFWGFQSLDGLRAFKMMILVYRKIFTEWNYPEDKVRGNFNLNFKLFKRYQPEIMIYSGQIMPKNIGIYISFFWKIALD